MRKSGFRKYSYAESLERLKGKSRYGLKQRPLRHSRSYKKREGIAWRLEVKERDDYTCQRCGYRGKENHAHHIAPRSRRPDLKFDRKNGVTLCSDCHRWVHENPIEAKAAGWLSDKTYEAARREAA